MTKLSQERVVTAATGAVWLVGSLSIVFSPCGALQEVRSLWMIDSPRAAAGVGAVGAAIEAYLGIHLLVRPTRWMLAMSAWLMAGLTLLLIHRGFAEGWSIPCHCLSLVTLQTTAGAVIRNAVLLAFAISCLVRRGVHGGAAQSAG